MDLRHRLDFDKKHSKDKAAPSAPVARLLQANTRHTAEPPAEMLELKERMALYHDW